MTVRLSTLRRRGRLLGCDLGDLTASWEPLRGGRLRLRQGSLTAELDVRVEGLLNGEAADLRQSFDAEPTVLPLEEGPGRVGVRSLWSLADADGATCGEAMQDAFVTGDGEVFLSLALRIVTRDTLVVERAGLGIELEGVEETAADEAGLLARGGDGGSLLVTWPGPRGRRHDTLRWQQPHAPFYDRWPPLFDQWSLDPETFGWHRFAGGGGSVGGARAGRASASVSWIAGEAVGAGAQLDLRGLVWIGLGSEERVRALARAHDEPLAPRVEGGSLRCYDELDGAYEIAAAPGDDCRVEFPPDPLERPLRVRVFGLEARGGLETDPGVDFLPLSERGRTDDPLVWIQVPAEGRADEALAVTSARSDRPTRVAVRGREGLHVAYQRRDPRRRLTVHHPADQDRPIATVDLSALHLVDLRLPGRARPAIHDAPLFWMRYLPKAALHLADRLAAAELVEASPELIALVLDSETPDGRVRSRYRIELPYRPDHVELRIRAELEGAADWGMPTFEYGDVFPEAGIEPSRWEYDRLGLVDAERVRVLSTRRPYPGLERRLEFPASIFDAVAAAGGELPGSGPWRVAGPAAAVFGGSERGTIVAVSAPPEPSGLEHVTTLCEHWADVHFDVALPGVAPVSSETSARNGGDAPAPPDNLAAELTVRVFDPAALPFEDAVGYARAAIASMTVQAH